VRAGCAHGPVVELLNRPGAENQRPAVDQHAVLAVGVSAVV
jgi:hypothetical protein